MLVWLPWSRPWVGMMSAPNAIMQPGSVTTSIMRLGDQKLTLTPNQKVAPLRQAHKGLEVDWASSALPNRSCGPIRTPPIVIGKMHDQRTLVMGLKILPASHLEAWAGAAAQSADMVAAIETARCRAGLICANPLRSCPHQPRSAGASVLVERRYRGQR